MSVHDVAGWDVAALRRGGTALTEAADSARSWVLRASSVEASLSAPQAWDGPASKSALADLRSWSAVAARVGPQLESLASGVAEAVGWYVLAQDSAETALRTAAGEGLTVTAAGEVVPGAQVDVTGMEPTQAAAALDRAAAAGAVQTRIEEALELAARGDALVASDAGVFAGLGIPGFGSGSSFPDLMSAVHVTPSTSQRLPEVPVGAGPAAVARWWAGLSLDEQLRLAHERPELVGGLDGVGAWARDLANRTLLDRIRWDPLSPDREFALALSDALAVAATDGRPAQLYLFDPAAGRAAVAVGDLDTAGDVTVIVPGVGTDVVGNMSEQAARAGALYSAGLGTGVDDDLAVLAWIGYDAPGLAGAIEPDAALLGAPLLVSALGGLTQRPGAPPPRTTVVAHSYGTLTTSRAAALPGRLPVDAVVLLGSPGTLGDAADFDVPTDRVFVGEGGRDHLVADSGWWGIDPGWTWAYGGTCVAADLPLTGGGHGDYFNADSEALLNMALIMRGRYSAVVGCHG